MNHYSVESSYSLKLIHLPVFLMFLYQDCLRQTPNLKNKNNIFINIYFLQDGHTTFCFVIPQ